MSDRSVTVRDAGRRTSAVLLLFALLALFAGVCHGAHGHALPLAAGPGVHGGPGGPGGPVGPGGPGGPGGPVGVVSASAPGLPHGCQRPGEGWSFDAHLPAQSAGSQPTAPGGAGQGGHVLLAYDEVFPQAPHLRRVHGRAGPGPEPGSLLIALGVNRN